MILLPYRTGPVDRHWPSTPADPDRAAMCSAAPDRWDIPSTDVQDQLRDLAGLRRPRLRRDRPILWRDQSTIQIGDDVTVTAVSRAHVAWLASLDGLATTEEIVDSLTIPEADAARLVRAAHAAGALDDGALIPASHRWLAADQRDRAAAILGAAMDVHRDIDLSLAVLDARDRTRIGIVGTGPVADAMASALGHASLHVSSEAPDLLVLADAPHPDVPLLMEHAGLAAPHLHVGVLGRRAVAGPLVVPGQTSCLRCAHLHRRDADRAWPVVAVQWAHAVAAMRPPPVDPLLAGLIAFHAAALIRLWIDAPEDTQQWAEAALEVRLPSADVQRVGRPAHPLCGCRWSEP